MHADSKPFAKKEGNLAGIVLTLLCRSSFAFPIFQCARAVRCAQPKERKMNSFIKRRTIVRKVGSLPMLFISISVASSALLASVAAFAVPISRPLQSKAVKQGDYFHTGAGARYLKRADADLVVESLRGNLTVLMGSGG